MSDTREFQSVVHAAEQAAAAGDYKSAEELLHAAALLQEASLGPLHPDLANTLNNLGVVCEITGNVADAERHFRRACEIATTTLEPGHPFVATSRKNLEDFCNTRGIAVDVPSAAATLPAPLASSAPLAPPAPPVMAVKRETPSRPPVPVEPDLPLSSPRIVADQVAPPIGRVDRPIERQTREDSGAVAAESPSRRIPVAALIAAALVVAILAGVIWRSRSTPADVPKAATASNPEPVAVAPPTVQAPAAAPASAPIVKPTPRAAGGADEAGNDSGASHDSAGSGRGAPVQGAVNWKRLALRSPRLAGRCWRRLLLLARQVSGGHHDPASVVPRWARASNGGAPDRRQRHRGLPHLQPHDREQSGLGGLEGRTHHQGRGRASRGTLRRAIDRDPGSAVAATAERAVVLSEAWP